MLEIGYINFAVHEWLYFDKYSEMPTVSKSLNFFKELFTLSSRYSFTFGRRQQLLQ